MAKLKYNGAPALLSAASVTNIYSKASAETLIGTAKAEGLWGKDGGVLIGGAGDDTYYLQGSGVAIVEEAGGGVDTLVAWKSVNLAAYQGIENLKVTGDKLFAAGDAFDNVIQGGEGAQQIYGGGGFDYLIGGAGADTFIIHKGEGSDVIGDFNPAEDRVRLKAGLSSFDEVKARLSQVGSDVRLDLGDGQGLIFADLNVASLTAANFQLELAASVKAVQTFAEEFDSFSIYHKTLNPTGVWRADYQKAANDVTSYSLTGNNEKQIYTSPYFRGHAGDFAETPFVQNADGTLSIWARPSTNPEIFGYDYTSGVITTKGGFSQTYGYFEMRADLPEASGAWPAFWLLPANGGWPPELDIMENLGDASRTFTTVHSSKGGHTQTGQSNYTPATADGFHTYGALWSPTEIIWYVDNVEVFRAATPSDMNKPMYMIANLALGGWAGALDPAAFPAEMKIDYIRAYALPDALAQSAAATPPASLGSTNVTTSPSGALVLTGTSGAETLTGGKGADTLWGLGGADTLDGGAGADAMVGGLGDDIYFVDNIKDLVIEAAGEGVDLVNSFVNFTLPDHVENMALRSAANLTGIGNGLANLITGNSGANVLQGMGGDDRLEGRGGKDRLEGGKGDDILLGGDGLDTFVFRAGDGRDQILDLQKSEKIEVYGYKSWTKIEARDGDVFVTFSAADSIQLHDVSISQATAAFSFL